MLLTGFDNINCALGIATPEHTEVNPGTPANPPHKKNIRVMKLIIRSLNKKFLHTQYAAKNPVQHAQNASWDNNSLGRLVS